MLMSLGTANEHNKSASWWTWLGGSTIYEACPAESQDTESAGQALSKLLLEGRSKESDVYWWYGLIERMERTDEATNLGMYGEQETSLA